MNRRRFLTAGTVALIAGCTGGGQSGPEAEGTPTPTQSPSPTPSPEPTPTATAAPPSFRVVDIQAPEEVEIGKAFSIEITVENTGGQAGSFSAPIYLKNTEYDWTEGPVWDFGTIQPGESVTERSAEVSLDYIDRYTFRMGESSTTAVAQTVSAKQRWGSVYTTPRGYKIRVDEPELQSSYEYEDYQGNTAESEPDSGFQWAFVNVWVKNETGQTNFSPLATEFPILAGNSQYDGSTYLIDEPVEKGQPFEGGELQPDVEREGWIAYQVPAELGVDDLVVGWSQTYFDGEVIVHWSSSP